MIVTIELPCFFEKRGQEHIKDLGVPGIEPEKELDNVTIVVNDICSFHPAYEPDHTYILASVKCYIAKIRYSDFKKLYNEKIKLIFNQ